MSPHPQPTDEQLAKRNEVVACFTERPMVAIQLGSLQEAEFLELMRLSYRTLRQYALVTLAAVNTANPNIEARSRSYEDILHAANNAKRFFPRRRP